MVSDYDIRIRSYLLWEAAGRPQGRDREFWFRAESDLQAEVRQAMSPWRRPLLLVVPGVPISSPPHRTTALRVPSRERKTA
ncbi:MAG TPA: DUF2934 domain-containing protein [Rhizomicrobium sp.]|jgi:hypothetical protein